MKEVIAVEKVSKDVLILEKHLMQMEAIREIEERQSGYPGDRKNERDRAVVLYLEHLPAVREILAREKG